MQTKELASRIASARSSLSFGCRRAKAVRSVHISNVVSKHYQNRSRTRDIEQSLFASVQSRATRALLSPQAAHFEAHERQEKVQQEMMSIQIKYQREIDRLEKELQSMKKQLLLKVDRGTSGKKQRKIKVRFHFILHRFPMPIVSTLTFRDLSSTCTVKYWTN